MNTAQDTLRAAAQHMDERATEYDSPGGERSMSKTVVAFNAITSRNITEAEGWLLMQLLKDSRQWARTNYHQDSAEDCTAYSALKAEAMEREQCEKMKRYDEGKSPRDRPDIQFKTYEKRKDKGIRI